MKITTTNDSATIGTTEYSLPSDSTTRTPQTSDVQLQAFVDLSAMEAGDQYRVRVYETLGGSERVVYEATRTGVQGEPVVTPPLLLSEGWDVTVVKVGGTDRAVAWSLRTLVEGETVDTASIVTAILGAAHESGRTLRGLFRRMDAFVAGKATGLLGSTATFYRADGTTKAIEATQNVEAGTRETASVVGGD